MPWKRSETRVFTWLFLSQQPLVLESSLLSLSSASQGGRDEGRMKLFSFSFWSYSQGSCSTVTKVCEVDPWALPGLLLFMDTCLNVDLKWGQQDLLLHHLGDITLQQSFVFHFQITPNQLQNCVTHIYCHSLFSEGETKDISGQVSHLDSKMCCVLDPGHICRPDWLQSPHSSTVFHYRPLTPQSPAPIRQPVTILLSHIHGPHSLAYAAEEETWSQGP